MTYIVIDLEMHPIDAGFCDERRICKLETIEIGAVALDEAYRPCGEFVSYVCPAYCSELHEKYVDMTGITEAQVRNAPGFGSAVKDFFSWCLSFGRDTVILAWSNSDKYQLVREMKLKRYEPSDEERILLGTWKDFQVEFAKLIKAPETPGLDRALDYAGLAFDGRQHDALVDARNTARLVTLTRTEPEQLKESAFAKYKGRGMSCRLGDMIDFAELLEKIKN